MAAHQEADRQISSCGAGSLTRPGRAKLGSPFDSGPLLPRHHQNRTNASHHRRARIPVLPIHPNHLPRLRRHQPHSPRHHINPLRIAQRSMFQPQRPIHLRQPAELTLRRLDLISVLNRLEMLPCISEHQQKQHRQRRPKLLHLAIPPRIFYLNQPRIVDRFGEVNLRRPCPQLTPPRHRSRNANCRRRRCHVMPPPPTPVHPATLESAIRKASAVPPRRQSVSAALRVQPALQSPSDPELVCPYTFPSLNLDSYH